MRLIAVREVEFPTPILIRSRSRVDSGVGPPDEKLPAPENAFHSLELDGFQVEATIRGFGNSAVGLPGADYWAVSASAATLKISREESEPPPPPIDLPGGGISHIELQEYLSARRGAYARAAHAFLNRFYQFFRFRMRQPLIGSRQAAYEGNHAAWVWYREDGSELWDERKRIAFATGGSPAGRLYPKHGVEAFGTAEDREALATWLASPDELPLYRQLAADAFDSVAQHDERRAVLDLVIAAEVAIQHILLDPATLAGAVVEQLEDRRRIRASAFDILNLARPLFTEQLSQRHYQALTDLVKCRNRVAHRGRLEELGPSGGWIALKRGRVNEWLTAVTALIDWLEEQRSAWRRT